MSKYQIFLLCCIIIGLAIIGHALKDVRIPLSRTVTVKAFSGGKLIGTWESNRIQWQSWDRLRFEDMSGKRVNINGDYIIEGIK